MFMQPSLVTHDNNKTGRSSDLGIPTQLRLPSFPVAYQNCAPPLQRRDREALTYFPILPVGHLFL